MVRSEWLLCVPVSLSLWSRQPPDRWYIKLPMKGPDDLQSCLPLVIYHMISSVIRLVTVRAINSAKSRFPIISVVEDHILLIFLPQFQYPATVSPIRNMSTSSQKRQSSLIAPVGHMFGNKLLSLANLKSHLPLPNKPKAQLQRRTFLAVAPIPFAPLVDTHAFQPPPPYSATPDESSELLAVPHNTPEESEQSMWNEDTLYNGISRLSLGGGEPVGLGLEGVEKCDGGRFDGLGRLSGGFRASLGGTSVVGDGTNHALRQVHKMLSEHSKRRRTRASEQPKKRHDVFYATTEGQENRGLVPAKAVKSRIRRKSVASPTPPPRARDVSRSTISSDLKRTASLERRASLAEVTNVWRV